MAKNEGLLSHAVAPTFAGVEERLGFGSATLSLIVSMVGTGIVAFPYGFALCGYAVGPVAVLLLGALAYFSYLALVRCTRAVEVASYGGLVQRLPIAWTHFTNIALWVLLILAITAYVLISADIIRSIAVKDDQSVPVELQNGVLFAIILCVILPLCLLKSLHGLAFISTYCTCAILAVVCLIVWKCIWIYVEAPPPLEKMASAQTQVNSVILAVPIFGCAMFGHMNISQIYAELKPGLKQKGGLLALVSCVAVTVLYMIVGFVGYLAFGRAATPDVVAQIAKHEGETGVVILIQGLLASFIVLKTPLLVLPLRNLTVALAAPDVNPAQLSTAKHVSVTVGLLVCVYVAAIVLPDLDKLLEILGAVCVVPLCFVVPARLSWSLESPRPVVTCVVLAVSGVLASALSLIAVMRT
eukprot:TRINITY_DN2565_c0_g1_i1.p1 TRINITY_DN2565_c0_g1~~TRINITY_DN2565_c0_g1_i1.p1  ORF type:complete len:413 (-),score=60.40 TRINITY_DN2565_c0_g1_i1:60-1298(-)